MWAADQPGSNARVVGRLGRTLAEGLLGDLVDVSRTEGDPFASAVHRDGVARDVAQLFSASLDQHRDLPVRKMLREFFDKIKSFNLLTANLRPPAVELPRDGDHAVL